MDVDEKRAAVGMEVDVDEKRAVVGMDVDVDVEAGIDDERLELCIQQLECFSARMTEASSTDTKLPEILCAKKFAENACDMIRLECDSEPEKASVGFVGVRGAGKSTIVNSLLLGKRRGLLPVGTGGSVTSSISTVRAWNSSADRKDYGAHVTFIELAEWESLFASAQASKSEDTEVEASRAFEDCLRALYHDDQRKLNKYLNQNWTDMKAIEFLPVRATKFIDQSFLFLKSETEKGLRTKLAQFNSDQARGQRFWPIVARIDIHGPFPSLGGVCLVDIPGSGDGNNMLSMRFSEGCAICDVLYIVVTSEHLMTRTTYDAIMSRWDLARVGLVVTHAKELLVFDADDEEQGWPGELGMKQGQTPEEKCDAIATSVRKKFVTYDTSAADWVHKLRIFCVDCVDDVFSKAQFGVDLLQGDTKKRVPETSLDTGRGSTVLGLLLESVDSMHSSDEMKKMADTLGDVLNRCPEVGNGEFVSTSRATETTWDADTCPALYANAHYMTLRCWFYRKQENLFQGILGYAVRKKFIYDLQEELSQRMKSLADDWERHLAQWEGKLPDEIISRLRAYLQTGVPMRKTMRKLVTEMASQRCAENKDLDVTELSASGPGCTKTMVDQLMAFFNDDDKRHHLVRVSTIAGRDIAKNLLHARQRRIVMRLKSWRKIASSGVFDNYREEIRSILSGIPSELDHPAASQTVSSATDLIQLSKIDGDLCELPDGYTGQKRRLQGFVYIMSNPSLRAGTYKIGLTKNDPTIRAKQLQTTGVPLPFHVEHAWDVMNMRSMETTLHRLFGSFRVNRKREFFTVPLERLKSVGNAVKKFVDAIVQDYLNQTGD